MQRIFAIYICILCIFSGCQNQSQNVVEQKLYLNIPSDPSTLDPRKGGDLISSIFHFMLFDGLVRFDDDGNTANAIAEKIELSEDRTVYTFTLKEAFWSDGTPITAWDFEKSWKDILHPDFPSMNAHLLYPVKNAEGAKKGISSLSEVGIKSLNAKTLEVTLERPTPYFLEIIAFCVFYPVNTEIDHSHPYWDQQIGENFICSGPFTIKEWKKNNYITLKKNPYYHKADEVILEEAQFNMVSSEMTSLQMFEKGEIDILGQPLIHLPTDAIPELAKKGQLQVFPDSATTFVTFNTETFPFNNIHIRKALGLAMNRKEIVRNITQLSERPALGMIPPALKKGPLVEYIKDADIESAKVHFQKGLEQLQITRKDFPPIKYLYSTSETHRKIAQALQQQWQQTFGIRVKLESVDKKILLHALKTGNYESAQTFWIAQYRDAMNILERFKYRDNVKNYANWENPVYISLLNQSHLAATPEERIDLLNQAEKIFVEEMPIAPIFHWNTALIAQPYVKSFGVAPISNGFYDRVFIDIEQKNKR